MTFKKENILVVDDNNDMLDLIQRQLKSFNYRTYKASSVNEAIDVLKNSVIDMLISDLYMPNINGIELLKYTEEHFPSIPKLVISGVPCVSNAINAMKSGALDYLTKPFTREELEKAILHLLQKKTFVYKTPPSSLNTQNKNSYGNLLGNSTQFKELIETIKRIKDTKANVLIEGESGTGKELVARAIHFSGKLADKPFIAVNCGGIAENLIESELFGHTKGSFTGAIDNRIGLFESASGGTIFLDEIGDAPLSVQVKLLRIIQEKEILKVGASKPEKIDVRILAATNQNLLDMVHKGSFREDLYYRLNVINIKTIPLRERKKDLRTLLNAFIERYSREYNKANIQLHEKASEVLMRYNWPGNIRELENVIHRLVIMSDEIITLDHIPENLKYRIPTSDTILKSLKEYEKEHILKVLDAVNNNKTKAAQILQIDRKTLNQKIL